MLGFLKPIKWQDLLEKGINGRNASRTGAKIHFSEKKHFGVMGTLKTSVNLTITSSNRFHSLFIRKNKKGKR